MALLKILILSFPLLCFSDPVVMFPASYSHGREEAYVNKNPLHLFEMGEIHYFGAKDHTTRKIFVKPDPNQAFKDFKRTYNLGHRKRSAPYLFHMKFYGEGTKKDRKEALKYGREVLQYGNREDKEKVLRTANKYKDEIQKIDSTFVESAFKDRHREQPMYQAPPKQLPIFDPRNPSTFPHVLGDPNFPQAQPSNERDANPWRYPSATKFKSEPKTPEELAKDLDERIRKQTERIFGNVRSERDANPWRYPSATKFKSEPKTPEELAKDLDERIRKQRERIFGNVRFKITEKNFPKFKSITTDIFNIKIKLLESYKRNVEASHLNRSVKSEIQINTDNWIRQLHKKAHRSKVAKPKQAQKLEEDFKETFSNFPFSNILRGVRIYNEKVSSNKDKDKDEDTDFLGNGFFYSSEFIVTNYHVIAYYKDVISKSKTGHHVKVKLVSGKHKSAELIYYDCDNDLALLKVKEASVQNRDLLNPDQIKLINQLANYGIIEKKDIDNMFKGILEKNPLTDSANPRAIVEYLRKDLKEVEIGKVVSFNGSFGILDNTEIVKGYSGGAVWYNNKLICVIQASKKSEPTGKAKTICISPKKIAYMINNRRKKTKPLCQCKNYTILEGFIKPYGVSKNIHILELGLALIHQASANSIDVAERYWNISNKRQETIRSIKAQIKKIDPNYKIQKPDICEVMNPTLRSQ